MLDNEGNNMIGKVIPGGDWFALFENEGTGKITALRVICWEMTAFTTTCGKEDRLVKGYVWNRLDVVSVYDNGYNHFLGYEYQYKEEKVMRRETKNIA